MTRTYDSAEMVEEFQGTVTCSESPCSYCREAAKTVVVAHPSGPFPTREGALLHAQGMSRAVFGASTHRAGIQRRQMTAWETLS